MLLYFVHCFNPRPYKRGDCSATLVTSPSTVFQSTPLQEGRPAVTWSSVPSHVFQSTPLQEGRRRADFPSSQLSSVSIHAPTRGATSVPLSSRPPGRSFNPRPYKRGDMIVARLLYVIHVSIHAPTRGATARSCLWTLPLVVSIHAPTRGATGSSRWCRG